MTHQPSLYRLSSFWRLSQYAAMAMMMACSGEVNAGRVQLAGMTCGSSLAVVIVFLFCFVLQVLARWWCLRRRCHIVVLVCLYMSLCQLPSSFRQPHSVHCPPGSPHPAHITSSQSPPSLSSPITASTFHCISFTNPFLHSHSYSFRTAFMDLNPLKPTVAIWVQL